MDNLENKLVLLINQNSLEEETKLSLQQKLMPFFQQATEWAAKAEQIYVTDVSQVREMQMARQARLALKDIRVEVEKTRKSLKDDIVKKGRAIDQIANYLKDLIEPIEEYLENQEKFAQIQEQKMKEERKLKRIEQLIPYGVTTEFFDLLNMNDEAFASLLNGSKKSYEDKIAEEKRIEQERIENERKLELDRKRRNDVARLVNFIPGYDSINFGELSDEGFGELVKFAINEKQKDDDAKEKQRIENERLRKEAAEKEKQLAIERAKADAERKKAEEKARKEREDAERTLKLQQDAARQAAEKAAAERAKLEAELKAKRDAEIAEQKAREDAERKAKNAPDKDKILRIAADLQAINVPQVSGEDAKKIVTDTFDLIDKVIKFINSKTENL